MTTLAEFADHIEKLQYVLPKIAASASADIGKLIVGGFAASADPYGVAWAPTQAGNAPLRGPTGKLLGSAKAQASGKAINMRASPRYAFFHQYGVGTNPQRMMFPHDAMPSAYRHAIAKAYSKELADAMKVPVGQLAAESAATAAATASAKAAKKKSAADKREETWIRVHRF